MTSFNAIFKFFRFYSEPDLTLPIQLADFENNDTVVYELRYSPAAKKWNRVQKMNANSEVIGQETGYSQSAP